MGASMGQRSVCLIIMAVFQIILTVATFYIEVIWGMDEPTSQLSQPTFFKFRLFCIAVYGVTAGVTLAAGIRGYKWLLYPAVGFNILTACIAGSCIMLAINEYGIYQITYTFTVAVFFISHVTMMFGIAISAMTSCRTCCSIQDEECGAGCPSNTGRYSPDSPAKVEQDSSPGV